MLITEYEGSYPYDMSVRVDGHPKYLELGEGVGMAAAGAAFTPEDLEARFQVHEHLVLLRHPDIWEMVRERRGPRAFVWWELRRRLRALEAGAWCRDAGLWWLENECNAHDLSLRMEVWEGQVEVACGALLLKFLEQARRRAPC